MPQHQVLIIEDEQSIRDTLQMTLEVEGYQATTSANGHEGLTRLQEGLCPCLILLDLMMPVMDGFEFLSAKRQDSAIADIPVVVVSAFPNEAHKVDAQGFIKKPVNLELLLDSLAHFCK